MDKLRTPIPDAFFERMQQLLGEECEAFAKSLGQQPTAGLRVNTLRLSPQRFRDISPFRTEPVPWSPAGFLLVDESQTGKHPYHAAGLYYMQDPSAMAVAELLDPQPGERVLDLAAAPGGKTTHIASLMQNQGLLIANEVHPKRAWELAENLERWGVRIAAVVQETPKRLSARWEGYFDRVLLDAPCSGEGMFRKSQSARKDWTPDLPRSCAQRQSTILEDAARLVRPGGRLAYSTCTFSPEENEAVIAQFLMDHPSFELVEAAHFPGFTAGRIDWLEDELAVEQGHPANLPLERAVRLWPHHLSGEGHFIALLERSQQHSTGRVNLARLSPLGREASRLWEGFRQEALLDPPEDLILAQTGSYLYALPYGLPELSGLKALHPGWWLGEVKKNRFQPSHALALGLPLESVHRNLNLKPGDAALPAYLHGEAIRQEGEDGWLLVGVDGFSLGWGKRVGDVVKNYYPRGLRWV